MKRSSAMQGAQYMENNSYQLRYLPLFEQDLIGVVNYITNVLKNEDAALRLINDVETAILKRLDNPLSYEPYPSTKKRDYPCLLYTSPSPRDRQKSRMPSSA